MNTEKVFTAFNKEGEEILLFRKDNDTYIDLNSDNNEIYNKDDIDFSTLIHAKRSLNLKRHMLMSSIKRKYNKDRSKLVYTKDILFGVERTIKNIEETTVHTPLEIIYRYNWENVDSDYFNLFEFKRTITIDKSNFDIYTNLFDKKEYILFNSSVKNISKLPSFGNGMKYVYSNLTFAETVNESIMEKKKVYEYANELRKHNIKEYKEG